MFWFRRRYAVSLLVFLVTVVSLFIGDHPHHASAQVTKLTESRTQKRWFFIWRDMSDPKEVDRMIARFPQAQAEGYNGVAFAAGIPAVKAPELRQASQKY